MKSVASGVSLQEQRKVRLTPAARQRYEIQNTMLSYIQKTTGNGDASDDELDLAFSSMAKRMRLNLNKTQKEQVLFKIQNVVGDCINNVLEGNPVNGPNQQFRPPVQQNIMYVQIPQMQLLGIKWVSFKKVIRQSRTTALETSLSRNCR